MSGTSRWLVHGERSLYDSPWVRLHLIDVEQPDGTRYEHHAIRSTARAAACVVLRGEGAAAEVLLLWRHRVVPDTWGWEVPAGRVELDETAVDAAARETLEETGWAVTGTRELLGFNAMGGVGDQRFVVCSARALQQVGQPDPAEADRVDWVPLTRVPALVAAGKVREGLTLVALLLVLSGPDGAGGPGPG